MRSSSLFTFLAGTASFLALANGSAAAQDGTQGAPEAEEFRDDQIIVTARRREETLLDVPESISVFDAAAIADAEIDEIADFGQLTPGVVIQQGFQGGDRPIVIFRGVGQIGGVAPSVVLLSDGIYLPAGDPLRNQLFDVERIEVVKGPQGALYGRDTIGGVINVITKEPENEAGLAGRFSYGSAEEIFAGAAANIPIVEDKLFARISGSYHSSDGFFDNLGGEKQDFREEFFVRGRLLWDISSAISADLRVSHNSFDNGANAGFFAPDADTFFDDIGVLNVVDFTGHSNRRAVTDTALKVEADLGIGVLTSITQYVTSDQDIIQDADFQLAPGLQIVRTSEQDYDAFSQELRLASPSDQRLRWLGGAFFETTDAVFGLEDVETAVGLGSFGRTDNTTDGERLGLFAQIDLDLTNALTVSGAFRYDKDELEQTVTAPTAAVNSIDVEEFSPKASVTYKASDNLSLYFNYGQGFRSGGFDLSSSLPFGTETLTSMEGGVKGVFLDGRVRAEGAVYRIKYTDQQVAIVIPDPVTGNLITSTVNLGESRNIGVEFGVEAQLADGLQIFMKGDYIDTEILADSNPDNIGNQSPFRTKFTGSIGGQYVHPLGSDLNLVARTEYYLQGPQTWNRENTLEQETYGLLSARLALQSGRWTLAASGENILDAEFNDQLFEIAPGLNFANPGLPARWRVTASVNF
ncbi:MAG: TonB-dependent receptor [Pseudomonadota bacterium]